MKRSDEKGGKDATRDGRPVSADSGLGPPSGPQFAVEVYSPKLAADEFDEMVARARTCAFDLAAEGTAVRYVGSLLLPGDETCFHVFAAPSVELVAEVSRRAGIAYERIVDAR